MGATAFKSRVYEAPSRLYGAMEKMSSGPLLPSYSCPPQGSLLVGSCATTLQPSCFQRAFAQGLESSQVLCSLSSRNPSRPPRHLLWPADTCLFHPSTCSEPVSHWKEVPRDKVEIYGDLLNCAFFHLRSGPDTRSASSHFSSKPLHLNL